MYVRRIEDLNLDDAEVTKVCNHSARMHYFGLFRSF